MFEWLWQSDNGLVLGALGFVTGIASLLYARSQSRGAHAQVEGARKQAVEALRAAELVAERAREQAAEALRAAGLVAEGAHEQAVEALRAASLVAESARQQALQALAAAQLLANSAVSARVREMRARNLRANPNLPKEVQSIMKKVGGPDAYSVMLDSMDIAQEIYFLRKRGMVSDEHWRMWMNDQMVLIAYSPSFQDVFRRAADQGVLFPQFVQAFEPVLRGHAIADPAEAPWAVPSRTQAPLGVARADETRFGAPAPATQLLPTRAQGSVAARALPPTETSGPRPGKA